MLNRRELLAASSALLASAAAAAPHLSSPFVQRSGTTFRRGGKPYRIAGTNMWYAAYLGAAAPMGNRDRLKRELDRLIALGIDNVRILGSSEYSPLKNSVRPTCRNSVTGRLYRDDPAIMAWQLANEPRPGGSDAAGKAHMRAYLAWIGSTARLIKTLDPNHLVSTGSEGTMGCIGDDECVANVHR